MLITYSLCKVLVKSLYHFFILVETVNQQMNKDRLKREHYQRMQHKFCFVFSFQFFLTNVMHIISATDFPVFCSKMPYSAGRMLAPKIAYSARNSAGRIYPSLVPSAGNLVPVTSAGNHVTFVKRGKMGNQGVNAGGLGNT